MNRVLTIYAAYPGAVTFRTAGDRPETVDRADLAEVRERVIVHGVAWVGHSSVDESDLAALTAAMDEAS